MTSLWSGYTIILITLTLIALARLAFAALKNHQRNTTTQTPDYVHSTSKTHKNLLTNGWSMLYIGTAICAVLYPGMDSWKEGVPSYGGGWTSAKQWEQKADRDSEKYGSIFARYAEMPIEDIANDEEAKKMGARLFANHCATCHGSDAKGTPGVPDLTDEYWRWGSSPETIRDVITNGRTAVMSPHGDLIGEDGVRDVAAYVRNQLAGLPLPKNTSFSLENGKLIFDTTCFACHGFDGKGLAILGAPDLTKPDGWIHGRSLPVLEETIRDGRMSTMPPAPRNLLSEGKIDLLTAYVYGLSSQDE